MPHQQCGKWVTKKDVGHYEHKEQRHNEGTSYAHTSKWREFVKTGEEQHRVGLEVDFDEIVRQLAWRAMRNKNGKAVFMGGAIILRDLGKVS